MHDETQRKTDRLRNQSIIEEERRSGCLPADFLVELVLGFWLNEFLRIAALRSRIVPGWRPTGLA
jgi:hypothetical protein